MAKSKKHPENKTKHWVYNPQREGDAPEGDEHVDSPDATLLKEIALNFGNVTYREMSELIKDIEEESITDQYYAALRPNMNFSGKKSHLIIAAMELYLSKKGLIEQVPVFELAIARGHIAMNPLFETCVPKDFYERMKRTQAQVKGIQNMTLAVLKIAMLDGGTRKKQGEEEVDYEHFHELDDLSTAFRGLYSVLETWLDENDIIKE